MALYMETTKIPPEKTVQEICAVLVAAGATNINQQYANKKLIGLRWMRARACFLANFELQCPICGAVVPANVKHACEVKDEPARERKTPSSGQPRPRGRIGGMRSQ